MQVAVFRTSRWKALLLSVFVGMGFHHKGAQLFAQELPNLEQPGLDVGAAEMIQTEQPGADRIEMEQPNSDAAELVQPIEPGTTGQAASRWKVSPHFDAKVTYDDNIF